MAQDRTPAVDLWLRKIGVGLRKRAEEMAANLGPDVRATDYIAVSNNPIFKDVVELNGITMRHDPVAPPGSLYLTLDPDKPAYRELLFAQFDRMSGYKPEPPLIPRDFHFRPVQSGYELFDHVDHERWNRIYPNPDVLVGQTFIVKVQHLNRDLLDRVQKSLDKRLDQLFESGEYNPEPEEDQ